MKLINDTCHIDNSKTPFTQILVPLLTLFVWLFGCNGTVLKDSSLGEITQLLAFIMATILCVASSHNKTLIQLFLLNDN